MAETQVKVNYDENSPYPVQCTETSGGYLVQQVQLTDGTSDPSPVSPALDSTITTTNLKLDDVNTNLGDIETKIDSVNTNLQTIEDSVIPSTDFDVAQIIVTDSEVELTTSLSGTRRMIQIRNTGGNTVWLGKTGVSISTGFALPDGEAVEYMLSATMYAIADTGNSSEVSVMELN